MKELVGSTRRSQTAEKIKVDRAEAEVEADAEAAAEVEVEVDSAELAQVEGGATTKSTTPRWRRGVKTR